ANVIINSNNGTARVFTIGATSSFAGDDFVIQSGSALTMNNATNEGQIVFAGTGNTGDISGTLTLGGSIDNRFTSTGGTSTSVLIKSTGVVNISHTATGVSMIGSASTLQFQNGSSCNITNATTWAPPVPLATWGATSNLNITGVTSSATGPTNAAQTFGNVTYNCTAATAAMSFWTTTTTAIVQGNLTITSTGTTGRFRATTTGTVVVQGNLVVTAGIFEVAGTTGTVTVNGNVNLNGGTLDIAPGGAAVLNVKGNFTQTAGTLNQTTATGKLVFNGTATQTFTPTSVTAAKLYIQINNSAGVTLAGAIGTLNINQLLLTSGIFNCGTNILYVSNTAAANVAGGSSSFVNGSLKRALINTAGTNYQFPVGSGSNYLPLTFTSGASTGPILEVKAFAANPAGTYSNGTVSTTEYWSVIYSGTVNGGLITLDRNASLGALNLVGQATSSNGAYTSLGGTVSGTAVTSTSAVGSVSLTRYYALLACAVPTANAGSNLTLCQGGTTTGLG
ncbi:MAG: beta strand repeat-containing protein, partial [Flavobacteriales bacterium]